MVFKISSSAALVAGKKSKVSAKQDTMCWYKWYKNPPIPWPMILRWVNSDNNAIFSPIRIASSGKEISYNSVLIALHKQNKTHKQI